MLALAHRSSRAITEREREREGYASEKQVRRLDDGKERKGERERERKKKLQTLKHDRADRC